MRFWSMVHLQVSHIAPLDLKFVYAILCPRMDQNIEPLIRQLLKKQLGLRVIDVKN